MAVDFSVTDGYGSGTYPNGANVSIQAYTPNPGSHFSHWTKGSCTIANIYSSSTTATMGALPTVEAWAIANYALNTYSLVYDAGTGGSITGDDDQEVTYGGDGTEVTAVPDANFHFVKWSDNKTNPSRTDTNITSDKSFTAMFAPDATYYALTVNSGTG